MSFPDFICGTCRHPKHPYGEACPVDEGCPCHVYQGLTSCTELQRLFTDAPPDHQRIIMLRTYELKIIQREEDYLAMKDLRNLLDLSSESSAADVLKALKPFTTKPFEPGQRVQSLSEDWDTTVRLSGDRTMHVFINNPWQSGGDPIYWPERDLQAITRDLKD